MGEFNPTPSTPKPQQHDDGLGVEEGEDGGDRVTTASPSSLLSSPLSTTQLPPSFQRGPVSPIRFAATTNAFGLSPSPSTSNMREQYLSQALALPVALPSAVQPATMAISPPSAGTVPTRRLRRPSMLSLATRPDEEVLRTATPQPRNVSPTSITSILGPGVLQPLAPLARWGVTPLTAISGGHPPISQDGSAPPLIESLTTRVSPLPRNTSGQGSGSGSGSGSGDVSAAMSLEGSRSQSPMDTDEMRSPPRWLPSHLQPPRRKGRGKDDDSDIDGGEQTPLTHPPFHGRPLPGPLLATLISESAPLEHEMRSEARLQRFLSSHPSVYPLTPRQRRHARSSRGRFPEMVGGDDDDDDDSSSHRDSRWRAGTSDSDSDEMMEDVPVDWQGGAVNNEFAAGMDLDRPMSSSSSSAWHSVPGGPKSDSGKSTPGHTQTTPVMQSKSNHPTPPGGSGGGANGNGWPKSARMSLSAGLVPSPGTGLQLPLAFGGLGMGGAGTPLGSPTVERTDLAMSPGSTSVSSPGMMQYRETSVRPGKRKANVEDRFDPYKRPRGSSPSPFPNSALSPSKPAAIPIPSSPSHVPMYTSSLASSSPGYLSLSNRPIKPVHPYTRPMTSRSRAASPALSIGSTSGVLSTSLGNNGFAGAAARSLGGPFIPTGQAAVASSSVAPGEAPQALGGLGLLSLGVDGEMIRESSNESRDAMEED